MLDVPVYSSQGQQVDTLNIDEAHLGGEVRVQLLKQAIVYYLANRRQGSASTKSRSMVAGSTRKIYRQKGTGRARMGNVRTGLRRGGGRAFAKRPRDFGQRMPKRMRRLAYRNAVLSKILAKELLVVDELSLTQPKTKELRAAIRALGGERGCVVALHEPNEAVYKAGRNIPRAEVKPAIELNAYDVLRRSKVIFTRPAFESLAAKAAQEYSE